MSHFSSTDCTLPTLTPQSFREAMRQIRALKDTQATSMGSRNLDAHWEMDWHRMATEEPALLRGMEQAQEENATQGEITMPPEVFDDLRQRGLLVWVEAK